MTDAISDKERLDALIAQCASIDSKLTSYHLVGARIIALGTTVIPAVLAVSIREELDALLMVLPVAMFAVLFYWINTNTWIVSQGGYKRYLEERINELLGERIFMWESGVVGRRHTNVSNVALNTMYSLVLILCIGGSLYGARSETWMVVLMIGVNSLGIAGLMICFARQKTEFQRTYLDTVEWAKAGPDEEAAESV